MRVLVAGMWQTDGVAAAAVAPFVRHRRRLARRHGITVRLAPVADLVALRNRLAVSEADVVVALTPWHADRTQTLALFRALHARPDRPALVYLDSFDQSSSPFFDLLPHVDLYVKKQHYRDLADYGRDDAGGFRFADFVHRRYGVAVPPGWHFGSPLPAACADRLVLGWNLATDESLRRLVPLAAAGVPRLLPRPIDVHCRVGTGRDTPDWWYYHPHRRAALARVRALGRRWRVVAAASEEERVSRWRFRAELLGSKLCVSPFGWGEIAYRDFEAILSGALLLKPDMGHLVTEPDLFRPWETYVPLRWDLSDLETQVATCLADQALRRRIAGNALRRLLRYYRAREDLARVVAVLREAARRRCAGAGLAGVVPGRPLPREQQQRGEETTCPTGA